MQFWWHHPNHARPSALARHASGFSRQEWTSVAGQHWSWSSFGWFGGRLPWKLTWDPKLGGFSNGVFSCIFSFHVNSCFWVFGWWFKIYWRGDLFFRARGMIWEWVAEFLCGGKSGEGFVQYDTPVTIIGYVPHKCRSSPGSYCGW